MVSVSLMCLGLLSLWVVRGEVAPNFDNCKEFFFREMPVSGLNIALPTPVETNTQNLPNPEKCLSAYNAASPAYICQIYNNQYYFATLYDRGRRIPLYSAYKMDIKGEPERNGSVVNYEPQLVHPDLAKDQRKMKECCIHIYNNILMNDCTESVPQYQPKYKLNWSQAVHDDFVSYDRGHLNPAGHHRRDASKATMTFTNVVPRNPKMNQWNQYEQKLKNVLSKGCSNMYVVTGVVPSNDWVDQNQRVNVPSHYWNAFCCTDNNNTPIRSGGALCPNTAEGQVTEYNTVEDLQNKLINEMSFGNHFKMFNHCQISSGVNNHVSFFSLLCLPILFPFPFLCCCAKCKKKNCNCM
ncbi:endonuclease domain-containing 1 protein-like [Esox lucius]|uniref:endonuclease domain-containing 1 protein-like n=1 Tax=Esox lucius TaxID=8010 RepID=UPI000577E2E0|nr:endonuclease domain-containing 1 protein-like [Esox lucius]